ncbi:MAG: cupredoxin domain-containing protein [Nanoarchaeota archaeon]
MVQGAESSAKMKNFTMIIIIFMLVIVVGTLVYSSSEEQSLTGNVVEDSIPAEDAQKVTLGMKNYNYYPDSIKVKAGKPVEITLDNSVYGCLRSFTLKEFGVKSYSRDPSEKIIFTPLKKGTFKFSCSMGMGYGKITVE